MPSKRSRKKAPGWNRLPRSLAIALGALLAIGVPVASGVIVQHENLRVTINAKMKPTRLPRSGQAPIAVSVGGQIATVDGSRPPQLESLSIELNRHGHLEYEGLPTCNISQIQPASSGAAYRACRASLVGKGKYTGTITLPGEPPYAIEGQLLVFNGREGGHEVLLGHVFSPKPFATSFVMIFQVMTLSHGTYGTMLRADLKRALGRKRSLTGIEMTLSRRYFAGGHVRSFVSAGCPAPKGFPGSTFPLAKTTFTFEGKDMVPATVERECRVG